MVADEVRHRGAAVGLLGPLTVTVDGTQRLITAAAATAVLACLALHAGEAVSANRLLDEIWGDDLPETGVRAVAFQISKLRNLLEPDRAGEGALITTSPAGYVLHVDRADVDALHFEQLLTRAASRGRASGEGRDAVSPRRWDCCVDNRSQTWARNDSSRSRHDGWTNACSWRGGRWPRRRIALGRHLDAIGDLESLIVVHPLEEALVELLMIALHRSGRTAEALRAFGELRLRLSQELGIEPSHGIRERERQLLTDSIERPPTIPQMPSRSHAALSSFVGRADELEMIVNLLSSVRLVTLCGFGGLGKTRLAQEVARNVGRRFPDGVQFIDLTPISDASLLADTFMAAGDVDTGSATDPVERLLTQLRHRTALLVVDNCEHVIDVVAELVTTIMQHAPDVRVLATSRLSLGVSGEAVVPIHPLGRASSVDLFVQRCQLVRPGFAVDESNRADVERLCRRLDGIPLAIELAAGRLAVMSVAQLIGHIDDRFQLLTRSGRNVDEKQRSLAAVLEWSYGLLDERDQTLLRRMSVCAGGFTLEAAARGSPAPRVSVPTSPTCSTGSAISSRLRSWRSTTPRGPTRFKMLETVRAYTTDRLDHNVTGEAAAASLAHASYYASVAATIRELADVDANSYIRLGDQEAGNLHDAIDWAYANGRPRLALGIVRDLWFWFVSRRMQVSAMRYLRTGIEQIDDDSPEVAEAAGLALIAADNSDDDDLDFRERAAGLIVRALDTIEDPTLRSTLLRSLAAYVAVTSPREAEAYLRAAADTVGASTLSRFLAIHNRVGYSSLIGRLDDQGEILRQIDALVEQVPAYAAAGGPTSGDSRGA